MGKDTLWICIVAGFILVFFILGYRENRNRRRNYLQKLRESWGRRPDRTYTKEQLKEIGEYAGEAGKDVFHIDEITWDDLDLDQIYMELNNTASSPGEEYLYYMLRTPSFKEKELEQREKIISRFASHAEEREKIQEILSKVKKPYQMSFWKTLQLQEEYDSGKPWKQVIMCLGFFLSLAYFIYDPSPGVFLFLGMCGINILTYVKDKGIIDLFLAGFRSVYELLEASEKIRKLKIRELEEYDACLESCEQAFAGFRTFSGLVLNREGFASGMESFLLDYFRMMTHMDLIKFNSMMEELKRHKKEAEKMYEILGFLDACISIGSYRNTLAYYTLPEFVSVKEDGRVFLDAEGLFHPLVREPVPNTIHAERGVLVTGSNASGKSTFLKAAALTAILAQTIHTCGARTYRAPFFKVLTSMALRDSLEKKESYFIVEIRSLKRILDETEEHTPVLCIIDEVLRGTNTIERIAASSRILAHLAEPHVLPFAATHDIELSYILEDIYENYHFEEEVKEKDVVFPYLLKKGRTSTRNAIKLLAMTGYEEEIIQESQDAVEAFETSGIWKKAGL